MLPSKNATSKVEDKKRASSYWQWENVLSYTKSFGRHNIGALFGTSMSSYHYSNLEAEDYNLLVVDIDKGYIDTATAPRRTVQSMGWGGTSTALQPYSDVSIIIMMKSICSKR